MANLVLGRRRCRGGPVSRLLDASDGRSAGGHEFCGRDGREPVLGFILNFEVTALPRSGHSALVNLLDPRASHLSAGFRRAALCYGFATPSDRRWPVGSGIPQITRRRKHPLRCRKKIRRAGWGVVGKLRSVVVTLALSGMTQTHADYEADQNAWLRSMSQLNEVDMSEAAVLFARCDKMTLVIENFPAAVSETGLRRKDLRESMESRMRSSRILSPERTSQYLYLNINGVEGRSA